MMQEKMDINNISKYDTTTIINFLKDDKSLSKVIDDALPLIIENNSENEIVDFAVELLKLRETDLVIGLNDLATDHNFFGVLLDSDLLNEIMDDYDLLKYYLSIVPDDYEWEFITDVVDSSLEGVGLERYKYIFETIIKTNESTLINHIIDFWTKDKVNWKESTIEKDVKEIENIIEHAKLV